MSDNKIEKIKWYIFANAVTSGFYRNSVDTKSKCGNISDEFVFHNALIY